MTEKKPRLRCDEAFAFNPAIAYVNNEFCVCVSRIRGSSIPLSLAKFSKGKYSPRYCRTLSLITPQYYRNRGESNEMSDVREGMATYDCKGTDASMTIQAKPGERVPCDCSHIGVYDREWSALDVLDEQVFISVL